MSLINEALKRAQRLRYEQQAAASGSSDSRPAHIEKRGRPMPAQTLILLIAGSAVLIVFSVVATVYLLNRSPAVKPAPAIAAIKPPPAAEATPSPVIVAPVIKPPASEIQSDSPAVKTPAPTRPVAAAAAPPSVVRSAPAAVQIPPILPAAPSHPAGPDPLVQNFVDAIRVAGVRSSGSESKVLMNDRVYRVNDIVDRTLGVKLVKVAADTLTFTDPNGIAYTKNF